MLDTHTVYMYYIPPCSVRVGVWLECVLVASLFCQGWGMVACVSCLVMVGVVTSLFCQSWGMVGVCVSCLPVLSGLGYGCLC